MAVFTERLPDFSSVLLSFDKDIVIGLAEVSVALRLSSTYEFEAEAVFTSLALCYGDRV